MYSSVAASTRVGRNNGAKLRCCISFATRSKHYTAATIVWQIYIAAANEGESVARLAMAHLPA
eukprot:7668219-Pyramimonas_sp.AAC.1